MLTSGCLKVAAYFAVILPQRFARSEFIILTELYLNGWAGVRIENSVSTPFGVAPIASLAYLRLEMNGCLSLKC